MKKFSPAINQHETDLHTSKIHVDITCILIKKFYFQNDTVDI